MVACHRNGIRDDNRPWNLRWATHQENIDDREIHGNTARGERAGFSRVTEKMVREMWEARSDGTSYGKIARFYGISKRQVMRILKREAWSHVEILSRCASAPSEVSVHREEIWQRIQRDRRAEEARARLDADRAVDRAEAAEGPGDVRVDRRVDGRVDRRDGPARDAGRGFGAGLE
jgi:alkylated DNA nucleotide flippase Atl1